MFEGLRKKFANFVDGLSGKEEQEERKDKAEAGMAAETAVEVRQLQEEPKQGTPADHAPGLQPPEVRKEAVREKAHEDRGDALERPKETKSVHEVLKQKAPDVSIATKIKGAFLGRVRISENDADPFLEQLRLSLLQSDVNYDVAERMVEKLRSGLVGRELESRHLKQGIGEEIRNTLMFTLSKSPGKDIVETAKAKRAGGQEPFKILFLGPNGAGKTTTIAKIASMLKTNGISCAISASDTFRAAAIEQAAMHAKALGIPVIRGSYGADPASIAFDAVAYSKAHGIDAVLIDSAGRQETNRSLIDELRKMVRVNRPDMCVFIGESIAGNSLLDQVKQFDAAVKLDGIILTKLDVDAKGGNTLSILSDTSIPVLYFGTGEKYTDLMQYSAKFIVDNIMPNS